MSLDRTNFQLWNETGGVRDSESVAHGEWWAWTQVISRAIWQSSARIGLAILTAGFALCAAILFQSPAGAAYGPMMIWLSLGLAAWFIMSIAVSSVRGR
jgi:hypothetical protein